MSRARHPLPTDLVALITHDGRVFPNEAKTWDRMGAGDSGPHPLGAALEQWLSFATGKHTWVSVRGATIRALVSARRRAKRSAWEVDCLINADEDTSVARSLLERMAADSGRQGAERVFLRLAADSDLTEVARSVGFFAYAHETLYRADDPFPVDDPALPLRSASKADAFGIYQLYCAVAPANVRAIEGLTFREWQAAREPWGGRTNDFVLEQAGIITGWLRLMRGGDGGRFAMLAHAEHASPEAFLREALTRLKGCRPLLVLSPAHGHPQGTRLRKLGFAAVGEYTTMAKRLARRVEEAAAERIGTAVTVS